MNDGSVVADMMMMGVVFYEFLCWVKGLRCMEEYSWNKKVTILIQTINEQKKDATPKMAVGLKMSSIRDEILYGSDLFVHHYVCLLYY